jgi:hypothetical protein
MFHKIFRERKLAIRYFTLLIYFYHSFRLTTAGEISDENQKKVTDLENEVHGLKVTVEKKEHAIKALREERDECLNRYVYLYFINNSTHCLSRLSKCSITSSVAVTCVL